MKRRTDRDILFTSMERRLRHVMKRVLDEYDARHESSRLGDIFKGDIKNMLNDMIRATRSECSDYDVTYRPVRIGPEGLNLTRTFLQALEVIDFTDTPSVRFMASEEKKSVLQSLRDEMGVGVLYREGEKYVCEVVGANDCVNGALPFLDRYRLHRSVVDQYRGWRERVVAAYRS